MTVADLESKLNTLRMKWKGKVPKSSADPNWWRFKCDEAVAIGLKRQIEEIKELGEDRTLEVDEQEKIAKESASEDEPLTEEKSESIALQIFGKHEN